MNLIIGIILGLLVVAALLYWRATLAGEAVAQSWLRNGAKVIDVRSTAEFDARHLPEAIHIPLGRLDEEIRQQAPDLERPLLLHCLSGGRSAIGVRRLKHLGYRKVLNLGSYGRARRIVEAARSPGGCEKG